MVTNKALIVYCMMVFEKHLILLLPFTDRDSYVSFDTENDFEFRV